MNDFVIAALIGIGAGTIDVVPMIIMKLDKMACVSAFAHYLVLGFIIPFVHWNLNPVLTGIIISFLSAIPVAAMVASEGKKVILPILLFSLFLGAGIGWAGAIFI